MHQCKLRSSATFRIYTTPQRAWLAWFWTAVDCHGKLLHFTVNLKRSTCLEFLWSLSLAPIILKEIFIISASIYSEVLSINNRRQFGEIFSNLEFIPVWTGGGRGWRPSSCKPCLSFLSWRPPAKSNFVKKRFRLANGPWRWKNTTNEFINILFNFIEIFRPKCYFDMQFLEFLHRVKETFTFIEAFLN